MSKRLLLALLATLALATACSSGGGNVTSPNSLNPTSVPTGFVASPTPSGTGATASPTASGATATPTPDASATPTIAASASPSAGAGTPTPTAAASSSAAATPTPVPSASAGAGGGLATTCATSSASPSSMSYTLNGMAQTIALPNYPASPPYQITGSSDVPSQSPSGVVLTLVLSENKIDNNEVAPSGKTADFYTTLEVSQSTTFGNGSTTLLIPVTIVSPCVVAGRTYTVTESSSGLTVYSETDTPTANGSVTGHIEASLNPFPANTVADIVVSH